MPRGRAPGPKASVVRIHHSARSHCSLRSPRALCRAAARPASPAGQVWAWQATTGADPLQIDPSVAYTVEFREDGGYLIQADCNSARTVQLIGSGPNLARLANRGHEVPVVVEHERPRRAAGNSGIPARRRSRHAGSEESQGHHG